MKSHGSRWLGPRALVAILAMVAGVLVATSTPAAANSMVVYNQNPVTGAAVIGPGCGSTDKYNYGSSGSWSGAGGDYTGSTSYGQSGGSSCSGSSVYILDQTTQTAQFRWHAHVFFPTGYTSTTCKIWAYIGTQAAGDYNARYDFWADDGSGNLHWLAWPGGNVDQEDHSGWTYLGQVSVNNTPTLTVTLNNVDTSRPGWDANAGDIAVSCPAQNPIPITPLYLQTVGTDTVNPVLSGVVSSPDGGQVTGKVFLTDSAGNPIGGSPTATGTVTSGQRVTYRVPDGALTSGSTYEWSMQACEAVCSSSTPTQSFTVDTSGSSASGSAILTLAGSALPSSSGIVTPGACGGSDCAMSSTAALTVGSDGVNAWRSTLKADVSAIPAGSQIASASLELTQSGCSGTCATHTDDVMPGISDVTSATTGPALNAAEATGAIASATGPADPGWVFDLTATVAGWVSGDLPDNGIVLQDDAEASATSGIQFYPATGPVGDQPELIIGYNPPAVPNAPGALTATSGDGGTLAQWQAPTANDTRGLTGYTVTVSAADGAQVQQVQTTDTRAVITGLTDGTGYTVAVTATNPTGTGPAATASVTPTAVPSGPTTYATAAQQFLTSRYDLQAGVYPDADTAVAANSLGPVFAATLADEATTDIAAITTLSAQNAVLSSPSVALSNTLASLGSDGVTVTLYTTGDYTYTTTVTDSSGAADSESGEELTNYLFTFATSPATTLISYVDADAVDQSTLDGQATASSTTLNDNPGIDTSNPPPDSSHVTTDSGETPSVSAPMFRIPYYNAAGAANWAYANAKKPSFYGFPEDCTDFASLSMRNGGLLGQDYYVNGAPPWDHSDDHDWYFISLHWWVGGTWSWSQAARLADYLNLSRRGHVVPLSAAQPGDVIFVNYTGQNGFWGIDHAGIVYKASSNPNNFLIAQHNYNAIDTLAYWHLKGARNMQVWVYRITG